jgi:leucyl-tRNA synthetase
VNGKVRERLEVSPSIGGDDLEKLARESPSIMRALEGKTVVNVVVRAPKVVSFQVTD